MHAMWGGNKTWARAHGLPHRPSVGHYMSNPMGHPINGLQIKILSKKTIKEKI